MPHRGAGACGRGSSPRWPSTRAATRQDQHSVLVDYDVFVNVPRLDAKDLKTVQRLYDAQGRSTSG